MATPWSDIILTVDTDLINYEPVLTQGLTPNHTVIKDHLEIDLQHRFRRLQERCREYYEDDDLNILDYIENPEVLKRPAIYLGLYLLFSQQGLGDERDIYTQKAKYYYGEYQKALEYACREIKWSEKIIDVEDEDGDVELVW